MFQGNAAAQNFTVGFQFHAERTLGLLRKLVAGQHVTHGREAGPEIAVRKFFNLHTVIDEGLGPGFRRWIGLVAIKHLDLLFLGWLLARLLAGQYFQTRCSGDALKLGPRIFRQLGIKRQLARLLGAGHQILVREFTQWPVIPNKSHHVIGNLGADRQDILGGRLGRGLCFGRCPGCRSLLCLVGGLLTRGQFSLGLPGQYLQAFLHIAGKLRHAGKTLGQLQPLPQLIIGQFSRRPAVLQEGAKFVRNFLDLSGGRLISYDRILGLGRHDKQDQGHKAGRQSGHLHLFAPLAPRRKGCAVKSCRCDVL